MMTIKQQGGIFGRNPTFNNLDVDGLTNFNDTVRIAKSSGTLLELYDADGGQDASTFSVTNGGRDMTIFAPQDTIFTQEGAETARFLNGGGLTFNGDTAAANALDDYEEGTWTPEVADAQTGGNTATGTFTGYYTKIGRMVNLMCILDNIDTTGMTGGNTLYVRNLPYAPSSLIGAQRALSNVMMLNVAFDTSSIVTAEVPDNFTYARIAECSSGGSRTFITVSDLTSGTADINLQFNYYT